MKRIMSPLMLPILLMTLWLLLNDSLSTGQVVLGALLSVILSIALAASKLRPLRAQARHPIVIAKLIAAVAWDITKSNIAVARIIWKDKRCDATPGFIHIPLRMRDPHGLAALACIVTYTPGTVWADYSDENGILTLHVLDLKDEQAWLDTIQLRYERPLLEIFK